MIKTNDVDSFILKMFLIWIINSRILVISFGMMTFHIIQDIIIIYEGIWSNFPKITIVILAVNIMSTRHQLNLMGTFLKKMIYNEQYKYVVIWVFLKIYWDERKLCCHITIIYFMYIMYCKSILYIIHINIWQNLLF